MQFTIEKRDDRFIVRVSITRAPFRFITSRLVRLLTRWRTPPVRSRDHAAPDDSPALLSEPAFAESWDRPEEDVAWAYLTDVARQARDEAVEDTAWRHLQSGQS